MELVHVESFFPLNAPIKKRNGKKKASEAEVTTQLSIPEKDTLVAGCSDGRIISWKPKYEFKTDVTKELLSGHLGTVFTLLYSPDIQPGLLFSGSADRTIRVWDIWDRDLQQRCMQTLVGHEGSVLKLVFGRDCLISCSTDKTIRVWRSDPHRTLLMYPWYICAQVLSSGTDLLAGPTAMGVLYRPESIALCVGEAKGHILKLLRARVDASALDGIATSDSLSGNAEQKLARASRDSRKRQARHDLLGHERARPLLPSTPASAASAPVHFCVERQIRLHSLSVSDMLVVSEDNIVVTISFDHTVQVHAALTDQSLMAAENPNRCRYSALAWDKVHHELILGDIEGHLQVWNLKNEPPLTNTKVSDYPIHSLTSMCGQPGSGGHCAVMVGDASGMHVWRLVRVAGFQEFKGHLGPVLKIVAGSDPTRIYSTALDSTIRAWDAFDMNCISIIRERDSEISSVLYLPQSIILFTGHDNGVIKMWNVDSGSSSPSQRTLQLISSRQLDRTPTSQQFGVLPCLREGSSNRVFAEVLTMPCCIFEEDSFSAVPSMALSLLGISRASAL